MLTQEPTETRQAAPRSRWPRAIAAFAVTILIVGAALVIWASSSDTEPVAAADAQIRATFTGDEAFYTGDREVIEGLATLTLVNETDAVEWFALLRFDTGSAELDAELAIADEGDDFVATENPPVIPSNFLVSPGDPTSVSKVLEPGTYIFDVTTAAAEGALHVWRAGVITVVAD